ncbi:GtrA family protein [Roseibium sp.]|uniref:GtrA family protein n=1 Tax=Roseibium sp. TaxID=1936156 RepID=UPI003B509D6A
MIMTAKGNRASLKTEANAAGKFAIVGVAATLTHAGVAAFLLETGLLPPMLANVAGFIIAFGVSFAGHFYWSFSHMRLERTALRAMLRFFLIAAGGFAVNSGVLALWLNLTPWPDLLGLMVAIAVVPALTFVAARFWAFSHTKASP